MHRLGPDFVLSSRYRLLELVASGGMGQVWAATDEVLERKVALKVTHPQEQQREALHQRFREEAKYAAQLSHPNIVEVFDFGVDDGLTFLVMEFIEGPTLAQVLAANGPLPADQVRAILSHVAGALARAHENGVVHRDLKPANVIISPDGFAKLMDFGIARSIDAQSHTVAGEVLGTTYYLSPEQALGQVVTPQSDLYSLGVLGHELLTGAKPFDRGTPIATALAHVTDPPPALPPGVAADLVSLIAACLAKEPGDRPASAGDVARGLPPGESTLVALIPEQPLKESAATRVTPDPGARATLAATEPWQPTWPVPSRPSRVLVDETCLVPVRVPNAV